MRILDREMARVVAGFQSVRRANARLLQLTRGGLLRRFFVGSIAHGRKAVYTLSPKGKDYVNAKLGGIHRGAERLIVGDLFVEHQTAINTIYLAVKYQPIGSYSESQSRKPSNSRRMLISTFEWVERCGPCSWK